jgi:hypothetical protein
MKVRFLAYLDNVRFLRKPSLVEATGSDRNVPNLARHSDRADCRKVSK